MKEKQIIQKMTTKVSRKLSCTDCNANKIQFIDMIGELDKERIGLAIDKSSPT